MNPNPYRTTLLVLGMVGLGLGAILSAYGGANIPELMPVGGFMFIAGAVFLVLWLLVSAILYGLTVRPERPGFTDWLGTPSKPQDEDAA